ncbi:hypothetical protein EV368DRAFT_43753 [Lentinula lateritia]|uniref:Uncharacterized protein n=1 Tax=Lentinula aff. lateritia TaxID=2804960 RepID=A0ACC1TV84_9AGAR|nr:hypothetical protein F5876DRAFT_45613 [Lentinula aff. lateritia]KAJ3851179.1 hypothetical protein EV368DRAFT_43753 [Lentinula lateritia]
MSEHSELLNVGDCCSICSQIDFLPIECPFCQTKFCKDHILVGAHLCPSANRIDSIGSFGKLQRCALDGCKNPSLNASSSLSNLPTCTACQGSFCAEHREPASHNCSQEGVSEPTKNESARALLAKNFTSSKSHKSALKRRISARPTDPAKLAAFRQLELMKLRQRASPLDRKHQSSAMPVDKRRFFKASLDGETSDLWIEKALMTGKAFDLLALHFGKSINATDSQKYQLLKISDDAGHLVPLLYDKPFEDQVEDGGEVVLSIERASFI